MKVRSSLIFGVALLFGSTTYAQDSPKVEITGDYSDFSVEPLPTVWNSQNLNGGGAQSALYFRSWLALAADLVWLKNSNGLKWRGLGFCTGTVRMGFSDPETAPTICVAGELLFRP
jgi:hypothetical protein